MKNADQPAFPTKHANFATDDQCGLTKREWFIGMTLTGLLANGADTNTWDAAVNQAVVVADKILERLSQ